jgi:hypothetical protein
VVGASLARPGLLTPRRTSGEGFFDMLTEALGAPSGQTFKLERPGQNGNATEGAARASAGKSAFRLGVLCAPQITSPAFLAFSTTRLLDAKVRRGSCMPRFAAFLLLWIDIAQLGKCYEI